jgi:hypothetical protein
LGNSSWEHFAANRQTYCFHHELSSHLGFHLLQPCCNGCKDQTRPFIVPFHRA